MSADVLFQPVQDGGDITLMSDGDLEQSPGFETAVYLSLFGGNEEDDGRAGNPASYWANLLELEEKHRIVSRTQFLLRTLPVTTTNLQRLRQAATVDLAWLIEERIVSEVLVAVSLAHLNRVSFVIDIKAQGLEVQFTFTANWKATV